MKIRTLFFAISFFTSFSLSGQSFVNPINKWYIDDCCAPIGPGDLSCNTNFYEFRNPINIGGLEYHELIHDNASPFFESLGKYYRQEGGKVYLKRDLGTDDILIYDFDAAVGEEIALGPDRAVIVQAIDSITIDSGEKRKRLTVADANKETLTTTWIEGIGSALAPMDTRYMFTFDCWVELDCFFEEEVVSYSVKDCSLTTGTDEILTGKKEVQIFPNPTPGELTIDVRKNTSLTRAEVLNLRGQTLYQLQNADLPTLSVMHLANGIYLLRLYFADGQQQILKFVKGN